MKRIGLVTWFGGSNYGTSLQAFALNYVILKLGAELLFDEEMFDMA